MQMAKKNRSASKGIIEAKDKGDFMRSTRDAQHFSPNATKRSNFGVYNQASMMQTQKSGNLSKDEFIENSVENSNLKHTNYMNYQSNQASVNLSHNPSSSNFQMYNKNAINSKNQYSVMPGISTSNISNTSNAFQQKNMKLESIRNLNTAMKKIKAPISGTSKSEISPVKKLDQNNFIKKKSTGLNSSNNASMIGLQSKGPVSLKGNNYTTNPVNNYVYKEKEVEQQSAKVSMNLFMEKPQGINLANSKLGSNQLNYSNSTKIGPLNTELLANNEIPGNKEVLYNINHKLSSVSNSVSPNKLKDKEKKKAMSSNTQETQDNSSNNSTINKHKNSAPYLTNDLINNQNIENPEDLHFFYVKMLQSNKSFIYKFEKEEDP